MPSSIVQAYRVNSGGSVMYQDTPLGSTTGTPAPAVVLARSDIVYDDAPAGRTIIMPLNHTITMTKNGATCGFGSLLLFTMPKAMTQFIAANVSLSLTAVGTGGLATGAAVVGALGKAAAANTDAILSVDEVTYVASTTCTMTAYIGAFSAVSSTTAAALVDDRTTARPVYLNFACPGADITATGEMVVAGTVKFAFNAV